MSKPYATRVGACADYLVGKSEDEIKLRWGVSRTIVVRWLLARGCFKVSRRYRKSERIKRR